MRLFKEFNIIYAGDDSLAELGIKSSSDSFCIDKATIDINAIQSYHKSKREGSDEDFTDVTVTMDNGEIYTVVMPYDNFKKFMEEHLD